MVLGRDLPWDLSGYDYTPGGRMSMRAGRPQRHHPKHSRNWRGVKTRVLAHVLGKWFLFPVTK